MEELPLKEQRQQIRKWYLMTTTPVPEYLKDENHICDPDTTAMDPDHCPACREMMEKSLERQNLGKYR